MALTGCIILAGGEFSEGEAETLRGLTGRADSGAVSADNELNCASSAENFYIIAADRGLEHALRFLIPVDLCIGDFDSVSDGARRQIEEWERSGAVEVVRLNPVKDDTDTEAALRTALERTDGDIYIFGGSGTRIDHLLANIHILQIALRAKRNAFLINAHNRIRLTDGSLILTGREQFGKFVSLFPFAGEVRGLTLTGFRYPLKKAVLAPGSSLGTSNEIAGEACRIDFDKGCLIVVESRD